MREFFLRLYAEHIEEASFLHGQCRSLRRDPETPWSALEGFEQRLEAHLDALVVGEQLALEVCRAKAEEGDDGDLFAAISVGCRHRDPQLLSMALLALDAETPKRADAVVDALRQELAPDWTRACVRGIRDSRPDVSAGWARVAGYRRIATEGSLGAAAATATPLQLEHLMWAAGRCPESGFTDILAPCYSGPDDALRAVALRTGLLLGDPLARQSALDQPGAVSSLIPIGLAGGASAARLLLRHLRTEAVPVESVIGLALLGDLSAVRPLLELLNHEQAGEAASQALFVITGAAMFETSTIADPLSEDELLSEELAKFRRTGELPMRSDGQPFGSTVTKLSRDPQVWGEWLRVHASRFKAGVRYRFGAMCSPGVVLRGLLNELAPPAYRAMFLDELRTRHGIDLALETEMPVARQRHLLHHALVQYGNVGEPSGRWSFSGTEVQ